MKKTIILLLATIFININACSGDYFDIDGSRAKYLVGVIHDGDIKEASNILKSPVETNLRFKHSKSEEPNVYKTCIGHALELGCSENKQRRSAMMPFLYLLKKHDFRVLPEDIEKAKKIAGRDEKGNKGVFKNISSNQKPNGAHTRGLVYLIEKLPKVNDYEFDELIEELAKENHLPY
ncbi:MAG: hypothetical protein ACJAZS_000137 [Alteromonas naphthalenivorans]|jgi:hypothetical protein